MSIHQSAKRPLRRGADAVGQVGSGVTAGPHGVFSEIVRSTVVLIFLDVGRVFLGSQASNCFFFFFFRSSNFLFPIEH